MLGMRPFSCLTKKVEDQMTLHFMDYNFVRIHKTLRVTPGIEAAVTNRLWTVDDIVSLLPEPTLVPRGPYKTRQSKA